MSLNTPVGLWDAASGAALLRLAVVGVACSWITGAAVAQFCGTLRPPAEAARPNCATTSGLAPPVVRPDAAVGCGRLANPKA